MGEGTARAHAQAAYAVTIGFGYFVRAEMHVDMWLSTARSDRSPAVPTTCACVVAAILLFTAAPAARAHPLSQGTLEVTVHPDVVTIRARVTLEEVSITNMLARLDDGAAAGISSAEPGGMDAACGRHAKYLARRLHVSADGRPLRGTVSRVLGPSAQPDARVDQATYEFDYREAGPTASGIGGPSVTASRAFNVVELRQDVLSQTSGALAAPWEATYVTSICQARHTPRSGLLLTNRKPIQLTCDWSGQGRFDAESGGVARVDRRRMAGEYLVHGVRHILAGYDHLLFVSALVLAATTLWDLLGLVTAFTVAHTITLALAATGRAHVPSAVVEPMIAASVVVVAMQNVLWPRRRRSSLGLAVAFGFGLFHGLGFAGGLLIAMREMPPSAKLIAIAAFSVGVEAGHQLIIVPLYAGLRLARRTRRQPAQRERLSAAARRYGSAAISLLGLFYLAVALSESLSASPTP